MLSLYQLAEQTLTRLSFIRPSAPSSKICVPIFGAFLLLPPSFIISELVFSYRLVIIQIVFSHIHYNTYFEFWRVLFVFSSCFAHKNMRLQMCPTLGVHIIFTIILTFNSIIAECEKD